MEKHKIEAVYNTQEMYENDYINYFQNLIVYQPKTFGDIVIEVERWEQFIDEEGEHTSEHWFDVLTVNGPVWDLIFEDIERCYGAFHAYAVGHDGSHLNYMIINYIGSENA